MSRAIRKCVFHWSGGKDSMLALHEVMQIEDIEVSYLLSTVNDAVDRISMHGVRTALLREQVEQLDMQWYPLRLPEMPGMETYEKAMEHHLRLIRAEGIGTSIYGDIFLEDLRVYREQKLQELGMSALFPLWKRNSAELVREFIALGYKTVVVCARKELKHLCGRVIDEAFLDELPEDVDPCGENGEFHTFVYDGPMFRNPVCFHLGELIYKTFETAEIKDAGYWYIDLVPAAEDYPGI